MGFQFTQDFHSGFYVLKSDSLGFLSKDCFRYPVLLAFFILDLYSSYDCCWKIRCQSDSSSTLATVLLAHSDGGLVSIDLETGPDIHHHSRRLV